MIQSLDVCSFTGLGKKRCHTSDWTQVLVGVKRRVFPNISVLWVLFTPQCDIIPGEAKMLMLNTLTKKITFNHFHLLHFFQ